MNKIMLSGISLPIKFLLQFFATLGSLSNFEKSLFTTKLFVESIWNSRLLIVISSVTRGVSSLENPYFQPCTAESELLLQYTFC